MTFLTSLESSPSKSCGKELVGLLTRSMTAVSPGLSETLSGCSANQSKFAVSPTLPSREELPITCFSWIAWFFSAAKEQTTWAQVWVSPYRELIVGALCNEAKETSPWDCRVVGVITWMLSLGGRGDAPTTFASWGWAAALATFPQTGCGNSTELVIWLGDPLPGDQKCWERKELASTHKPFDPSPYHSLSPLVPNPKNHPSRLPPSIPLQIASRAYPQSQDRWKPACPPYWQVFPRPLKKQDVLVATTVSKLTPFAKDLTWAQCCVSMVWLSEFDHSETKAPPQDSASILLQGKFYDDESIWPRENLHFLFNLPYFERKTLDTFHLDFEVQGVT